MKKRLIAGILWMIAIFALVVGRRVFDAINHPGYSVHWFVYVAGIGIPFLLMLLPRLITAVGIDIAANNISLRYTTGRVREYEPQTICIKSQNRNVLAFEGRLLDGRRKVSYLLSGGFSKRDWTEITSTLEALSSKEFS